MSNQLALDLSETEHASKSPVKSRFQMYQPVIAIYTHETEIELNGEKKKLNTPYEIKGMFQFFRDDSTVVVSHKVVDLPHVLKPNRSMSFIFRDYKVEDVTAAKE